MLHIVNKSHRQTGSLASCLRLARPGHALLLTEDGVLAAAQATAAASGVAAALATLEIYVLLPDVEARGIAGKLIAGVTAIGYDGFVDLAAELPTNHSWL
ncbi:MAG: sulfurtransferase complex subunit TusB [Burkholderiales bacterium]|nr:sulfurtransferase complex subunit TusB [Burkholderiales bacterium]